MMRAELEPLGFEVRWVDMRETGRAGHIIATHHGNGRGKRLLLIGHLDTVFEPDSPFQRFARDGNRATGPGVGDCKGGNAVIVAALRAMHAAGTLHDADIIVVFTGDEERPGSPLAIARRDLVEAGRNADVALEFENLAREDGRDFGTIARRSSTSWTLRARGRNGHSSGIFRDDLGYGAIYEMARILDGFRRELPEPNLTYNVGVIGGGTPAEMDEQGLRIAARARPTSLQTAIARRHRTPTASRRPCGHGCSDRCPAPSPDERQPSSPRMDIRQWHRRKGTGDCSPASTSSIATSTFRKCPNMIRPAAVRPIPASSPATSTPWRGWARPAAAPMPRARMSSSTAWSVRHNAWPSS